MDLKAKTRPLVGGIQITNNKKDAANKAEAGTLGYFGTYRKDGKALTVLLSNHHVLFYQGGAASSKVYQPDLFDEANVIGEVVDGFIGHINFQYKEDTQPLAYFVDCAIAKIYNQKEKCCCCSCDGPVQQENTFAEYG